MRKNVELERGPPQSWQLDYINKTQGEMEILSGMYACVTMCMCVNIVHQLEHLPFLPGTAVQAY